MAKSVCITSGGSTSITNSFGGVTVSDVTGDLRVHNGNGTVDANDISGAAELETSFGSIRFINIKQRLSCRTSNGNVSGSDAGGANHNPRKLRHCRCPRHRRLTRSGRPEWTVNVRAIHGPLQVRNSFSNVEATDIHGDATINSSNGRIRLAQIDGSVELQTSFGNVDISTVKGRVRVINGNARVTVIDAGGETFIKTSFGLAHAERIGGSLTVENSNGSVKALTIHGAASVRTSFGSVSLAGIEGAVDVDDSNGSLEVSGVPAKNSAGACNAITLRTSFSPIRLYLPDGAAYNVAAHTSFGKVTSDLPITATGDLSGDSINGTINGGGCQLQLNNSNGGITISHGAAAPHE